MKNKWLFFDVVSTLVDEPEAYNHRIRDMLEGTKLTFEQFLIRTDRYFLNYKYH